MDKVLLGYCNAIKDTGSQYLNWAKNCDCLATVAQKGGVAINATKDGIINNGSTAIRIIAGKTVELWQATLPFLQIVKEVAISNLGISTICLLTSLIILNAARNTETQMLAAAMTAASIALAVLSGLLLIGTAIVPLPIMVPVI